MLIDGLQVEYLKGVTSILTLGHANHENVPEETKYCDTY